MPLKNTTLCFPLLKCFGARTNIKGVLLFRSVVKRRCLNWVFDSRFREFLLKNLYWLVTKTKVAEDVKQIKLFIDNSVF